MFFIRQKIYKINRTSSDNDKLNILVVGGSQGAKVFDHELKKKFVNISKKFQIKIYHQTSEKNIQILNCQYLIQQDLRDQMRLTA